MQGVEFEQHGRESRGGASGGCGSQQRREQRGASPGNGRAGARAAAWVEPGAARHLPRQVDHKVALATLARGRGAAGCLAAVAGVFRTLRRRSVGRVRPAGCGAGMVLGSRRREREAARARAPSPAPASSRHSEEALVRHAPPQRHQHRAPPSRTVQRRRAAEVRRRTGKGAEGGGRREEGATYSLRPLPAVSTWSGLCGDQWIAHGGRASRDDIAVCSQPRPLLKFRCKLRRVRHSFPVVRGGVAPSTTMVTAVSLWLSCVSTFSTLPLEEDELHIEITALGRSVTPCLTTTPTPGSLACWP